MQKHNALLIALAVAAAAAFGLLAANRTTHLRTAGAKAGSVSQAQIASRNRALDRTEIALRKALAQKPPKLPPLPAAAMANSAPAAAPAAAPSAQRVIYVRPAPIIKRVHRAGGEHESGHDGGHESEGGGHAGGGFDD